MNIIYSGQCDPWGARHLRVSSQKIKPAGSDEDDFIVVLEEDSANVPGINLLQPKPTGYNSWGLPNFSKLSVTQGMFEEVFFGSSAHCISGEKESAFWQFMQGYFTAHGHVVPEAFHEILQASYWAALLESGSFAEESDVKLGELAKSIAKEIGSMSVCSGRIIPSGPFVTIRIRRMTLCNTSGYELEIFSRNKQVLNSEVVSIGGREKLTHQHFTGLPLSQVTDQHWLQLLLQVASGASSSVEIYNQFLAPLRGYLKDKTNKKYHLSKSGFCRIQNLWDLFGERLGSNKSRKNLVLRKLEMQLEVLLGYFYRVQSTLYYDSTAFVYLKDALQKVSRRMLTAHHEGFFSSGSVTDKSFDLINTELQLIDEKLKSIEKKAFSCQSPSCIKGSQVSVPISLPNLYSPKGNALRQSFQSSSLLISTGEKSSKITPYPYELSQINVYSKNGVQAGLSGKNPMGILATLLDYLSNSEVPVYQREQRAVDVLLSLPLNPGGFLDPWAEFIPSSRIEVSLLLELVSKRITAFVAQTSLLLPDRFLALVKATAIVDYLARLNESSTKLTKFRINEDLYELILDLLRGSAASDEYRTKRSYLANSVYKVRDPLEYAVILELKQYCHWHLPEEFNCHFTQDLDLNHEFSEWRDSSSRLCSFNQFKCSDVLLDLTQAPYRNDPQCQNLQNMLKNMRQVLKIEDKQKVNLSEWLERWGRPIVHPIFLALAYAFKVERGELSAFNNRSNSYTPEAIMDDPWLAVERAYKSWQQDLGPDHAYKKVPFDQAKAVPLNYFSDNDLKALLLACTNWNCIRSLLGAIKQNVLMLRNKAIRGFIEHMILRPGVLQSTLDYDGAIKNPHYLNKFFNEYVEQLERLQEIPIALFMVGLCRRIERAWPEQSFVIRPFFEKNLKRWLESSSQPDSPLKSYRFAIISELLDEYGSASMLNHQQLKDFILLKSVWDSTPIEGDFDPVHKDYINRLYHRLQPTISIILDKEEHLALRNHILDTIGAANGLKTGNWMGVYPEYFNIYGRINLANGRLAFGFIMSKITRLPVSILQNPQFIDAFPGFAENPIPCETTGSEDVIEYNFTDPNGIMNLIEDRKGSLTIYKASSHTGFAWGQFVPTVNDGQQQQHPLVRHNRIYYSKSTNKAYLFNLKGRPEFVSDLAYAPEQKKLTITTLKNISDLRSVPSDFTATLFDPIVHPDLKPLQALANGSEILLWSLNGVLKEVEFYNGNSSPLVFIVREGQFYGKTKGLEQFVIDFSASFIHGVPLGLVLSPIDKSKGHSRWLLPHFSGNYVLDKHKAGFYDHVFSLFKSYWSQNSGSVEWATSDHCQWHFEEDRKIDYWTIDISLPTCTLQDPDPSQNYKQYFDLFKYCLLTIQNRGPVCALMARECLSKLTTVASHKITSKDLEGFIRDIYLMADPPNQAIYKYTACPEVICLVLRCLLIMHAKVSLAYRATIEKQVVKLTPRYFDAGSKIDSAVKLLESEEKSCLLLMQKYRPKWFQKHAPLIVDPKMTGIVTHSKRKIVQTSTPSFRSKPLKLSYSYVKEFLYKDGTSTNLEYSPESILPGFRKIYQIAGGGAVQQKEPQFIEMFYRLKKSASLYLQEQSDSDRERGRLCGQEKKVSKTGSRTWMRNGADDLDLLLEYLEAVFEIKMRKPNLILPDLPNSLDQVEAFCQELTDWVTEHYPTTRQPLKTPIQDDISDKIVIRLIDELLNEKSVSVQRSIPLEELERRLKSLSPTVKSPIKLQIQYTQNSGAFLAMDTLNEVFGIFDSSYPFGLLKIDQLKNKSNRNVQMAVDILKEEIALLVKSPRIRYRIVSVEYLKFVNYGVRDNAIESLATARKLKQEIEEMLARSSSCSLNSLHKLAGLDCPLTFEEIVVAYLQNDIAGIVQKRGEIAVDELKEKLTSYFKAEIQGKYSLYVHGEIEDLLKNEDLSMFYNAAEELDGLLTRHRCFNPEENPELLAMEYLLGIMIRKDQLQMITDFLEKANCIRRAETGAGKTSVIIRLVGFLKANGSNLVTVKFLNSQFNRNCDEIFKLLGSACKKKVLALLYNSEMPLTYEQQVNGKKVTISLFQKLYEDLLGVIINKGCVITDKKTQPLLTTKMIETYDRLSELPSDERSEIDLDHLHQLGKLYCLFREKEDVLIDEFDKFLFPFDEFHFLIKEGKLLPRFAADTALDLYDLLLQDLTLALTKNSQAELSLVAQKEILWKAAYAVAQQWTKKIPVLKTQIVSYLQGTLSIEEENQFLNGIKQRLSPSDLDRLAFQKDMISKFLKVTLFKAADHKYIRSEKDGKSVIPCEYADKPKEGSEFEDVCVKLCYMIQYYYQRGISFTHFEKWVNGLKALAVESLINNKARSYSETIGERNFKDYFPSHSLEFINPKKIKELYEQFQEKKDSSLLRKYLAIVTQELRLPGRKISLTPHNEVSISKSASGTSATKGCLEGLHRNFDVKEHVKLEKERSSTARMLSRMLERIDPKEPFIYFDQSTPERIIDKIRTSDPSIKVVIDGAGALRGMGPSLPAHQLLQGRLDISGVTYFDSQGFKRTVGQEDDDKGVVFSHAQSRGADVKIPLRDKAVLLANGRMPQEEVTQNEGRLRNKDQKMRIALPKGSQCKDIGDLINAQMVVEAEENSVKLLLSKKHEMQDLVHSEMTFELAQHASRKDFTSGFKAFSKFQEHLVSEFKEDWSTPGGYFAAHGKIERPKNDNVEVLNDTKAYFLDIARKCELSENTIAALNSCNPESYRHLLPDSDISTLGDREVQVENETHTEVVTELFLDVNKIANKPKVPFYLPWGWYSRKYGTPKDVSYKKVNSAYDKALVFSSNFLPLDRNEGAPQGHQRQPHDPRQLRLHCISVGTNVARALDPLDVENYQISLYDTKMNCFFIKDSGSGSYSLFNPQKTRVSLYNRVAQMRFEDGQYSGYLPEEWQALTEWIKENPDPQRMEEYFRDEILKNRPQDRERYLFSELRALFQSVEKNSRG